ncbi:MAG: hypothetical protein PHR96_02660 [Clostridia bacterium]|nr:hypothetical protein [Clostridia bacterium]
METLKQIIQSSSFIKFEKFIKQNRLSHSYFINSEDEEFNKQFCKAVSLKLVCENSANNPCFKCDGCLKVLSDFHPDIFVYPKNAGDNFLVEDSASIIKNANVKPMIINYKIFIINDMDKSTVQAQNKLLKILEESPKNVIFLLNSTNMNGILQTIISRTQVFYLEPLKAEAISKILQDKNGKVDFLAVSLGKGWLGKTIALTSEKISEDYNFILDMLSNMKSSKMIINYIGKFSQKGIFLNKINILQEIMEKILYAHFNPSEEPKIQNLVKDYNVDTIYCIFNLITLAKKQFEANVNVNIITDFLLFKILEVKYLCNLKK